MISDPEAGPPDRPVTPAPLTGRLRVYPRLILFANLALTVVMAVMYVQETWRPCLYCDFLAFYTAAELAAAGDLAGAYDGSVIRPLQYTHTILPDADDWVPFFYPPTFLFVIFWLPGLSIYAAATLFVTVTFGLFLLAVRPLLADRDDLILLFAAPVVWVNAWDGQNAFFTAALAVFAYRWLMVRQVRAGLALALLTIKPHLGLLWPVVLLAHRRWIAIAVAGAGAVLLASAAALVYGSEAWQAFAAVGLSNVHETLSLGALPISTVSSPYAWLTLLGAPDAVAMAGHLAAALGALGVLVHLLWIGTPYRFVMAYLFTATLFVTPHNFTYDWMFVLVGMGIVWQEARLTGFLRYELAGLVLGYVAPVVIQTLRDQDLPIAAPMLAVVIVTVARRAYHEAELAAGAQALVPETEGRT